MADYDSIEAALKVAAATAAAPEAKATTKAPATTPKSPKAGSTCMAVGTEVKTEPSGPTLAGGGVSKDAAMRTDIPSEGEPKKKKSEKGKTTKKPTPSVNDTLVATYTAAKRTCMTLLRELTSGNVVFFNSKDIIVKSGEYKYRVYSAVGTKDVRYNANKDLLESQAVKLKYTSKTPITETLSKLKAASSDLGETFSLCLYGVKSDLSPVTAADIQGNKCWFYVVISNGTLTTDPVFIKYIKANKKQVRLRYGEGELHPMLGSACILRLNNAGIAERRDACKGYMEMVFRTEKGRFQTYWVKKSDLPSQLVNVQCHIIREGNTVYVSIPSFVVDGRFYVIVGVRKKFARARVSKAASYSDDTEEDETTSVTSEEDAPAAAATKGEEKEMYSFTAVEAKDDGDDDEEDEEEDMEEEAKKKTPKVVLFKKKRIIESDSEDEVGPPPKKAKKHISATVSRSLEDDTSDSE